MILFGHNWTRPLQLGKILIVSWPSFRAQISDWTEAEAMW